MYLKKNVYFKVILCHHLDQKMMTPLSISIIMFLVCNGLTSGAADHKSRHRPSRSRERPNIIVIMTDDQDSELGKILTSQY